MPDELTNGQYREALVIAVAREGSASLTVRAA
jgi:hypothetical protein